MSWEWAWGSNGGTLEGKGGEHSEGGRGDPETKPDVEEKRVIELKESRSNPRKIHSWKRNNFKP